MTELPPLISAATRSVPSQFKIGYGTTTPTVADTDLANKYPISGTESVDNCDVTTGWTDSADMTISVNSTTFKEGVASLNLTKDGTTTVNANTSKTTPSLDFTNKELNIWLNIIDTAALNKLATTAAFSIRFGSDSSNFFQWDKDKTDLAVGFNLIDGLTSANATSTTGSPVLTAMDFTLVQLTSVNTSDTWATGDFLMDDIRIASSDDFLKNFTSGFPSIDTTARIAQIRGLILTTEANNQDLTEVGMFNTDGTPLMFSRAVFTKITKNLSNQITIIEKNTFA